MDLDGTPVHTSRYSWMEDNPKSPSPPQVLLFDAVVVPMRDPAYMFDEPPPLPSPFPPPGAAV